MNLGRWLKGAGVSQREFVRRTGLCKRTIQRILAGQDVQVSTAVMVEEYTLGGVTVQDIANAYVDRQTRAGLPILKAKDGAKLVARWADHVPG